MYYIFLYSHTALSIKRNISSSSCLHLTNFCSKIIYSSVRTVKVTIERPVNFKCHSISPAYLDSGGKNLKKKIKTRNGYFYKNNITNGRQRE